MDHICDRFAPPDGARDPYDCPICHQTTERNGDHEPRTTECGTAGCKVLLCPACPQFVCDGCQLTHCLEHAVELAGLKLCPDCMAEISETAAEIAAEAEETV